jgi:hypothetical protein
MNVTMTNRRIHLVIGHSNTISGQLAEQLLAFKECSALRNILFCRYVVKTFLVTFWNRSLDVWIQDMN